MRKFVIGMAMASTALATPALARDDSWYIGAEFGPMMAEDMDLDVLNSDGDSVDTVTVGTDYGFDGGGYVGYDFGMFRLEAEVSYRDADVDEAQIGSTGIASGLGPDGVTPAGSYVATGGIDALSFMLNGLLDFGPDDGLQGYVGGGIGVARTSVTTRVNVNGSPSIDDSSSDLAWQILAGVQAPLTDNIDVGLRYRMFTAEDVQLVDLGGRDLEGKFRTHSIMGTLNYNFGAPPPPAPVCQQGPYIVFFNWDESAITPEAATILDNAVSAYANCGTAAVMLAGHTDTSGSAQYNMGLAERRNTSVREYLSSRGVPGGRISTEAFGETQLRVPTADGVRELQNRRVEITYGPGSGM